MLRVRVEYCVNIILERRTMYNGWVKWKRLIIIICQSCVKDASPKVSGVNYVVLTMELLNAKYLDNHKSIEFVRVYVRSLSSSHSSESVGVVISVVIWCCPQYITNSGSNLTLDILRAMKAVKLMIETCSKLGQ